jgi:hypothetical protein
MTSQDLDHQKPASYQTHVELASQMGVQPLSEQEFATAVASIHDLRKMTDDELLATANDALKEFLSK